MWKNAEGGQPFNYVIVCLHIFYGSHVYKYNIIYE